MGVPNHLSDAEIMGVPNHCVPNHWVPRLWVSQTIPADTLKVQNLDSLLNLGQRWTREFKAEYRGLQREAQRRYRSDLPALQQRLMDYRQSLSAAEPHHEVHALLAEVLLDPARLQAFAE